MGGGQLSEMKKNSRKFLDFKKGLSDLFKSRGFKSKETKRLDQRRAQYQQALEEVKQREIQEMGRTLTRKELADENAKRARRILLSLMYDDSVSAKWVLSEEDIENLDNSGNFGLTSRYKHDKDKTQLSGTRKTVEELVQRYKIFGVTKPGDMVWFDSSRGTSVYKHWLVKKQFMDERSCTMTLDSLGNTKMGPSLEPATKEELDQLWHSRGYDQWVLEYRNRTHLIPKVNKWTKVVCIPGAQWNSIKVISPERYTLAMFLGYEEDERFDSLPEGVEETELNKIRWPKWLIEDQIWVGWPNANDYGMLQKDHFTKGITFSND